jgi:hypothetical protein
MTKEQILVIMVLLMMPFFIYGLSIILNNINEKIIYKRAVKKNNIKAEKDRIDSIERRTMWNFDEIVNIKIRLSDIEKKEWK